VDDEWDDLHDGEVVDLDGYGEATGDPQLDQFGYQSPKQRGGTGFTSTDGERLARVRAQRAEREQRRRAAVEQNKAETRQRVAQRSWAAQPPPHIAAAVEQGAPGRPAGWWKVDISPDGSAQWSKVDQPGDGPWITATTPAPPAPAPHWSPIEMTEPSPGTRVW
jgi:hypothetical protein